MLVREREVAGLSEGRCQRLYHSVYWLPLVHARPCRCTISYMLCRYDEDAVGLGRPAREDR